jgi:hypothetical protein
MTENVKNNDNSTINDSCENDANVKMNETLIKSVEIVQNVKTKLLNLRLNQANLFCVGQQG